MILKQNGVMLVFPEHLNYLKDTGRKLILKTRNSQLNDK